MQDETCGVPTGTSYKKGAVETKLSTNSLKDKTAVHWNWEKLK